MQKNLNKLTKVNKFLVIKIPGNLGGKAATDADDLDEYEHFHMLPYRQNTSATNLISARFVVRYLKEV